jgi:RNA polymerase sigma factor (sigma-70 family)
MSYTTHESLLLRLRRQPADEDAWARFVAGYEPLIRSWCRDRGLDDADVDDVGQDVLTKLVTALRTFSYDPSKRFRGWLRIVVSHALSDYQTQRRREPARGSGDSRVLEQLANQEACDDFVARLDRAFDLERLDRAMAMIQARVAPHNWQAFAMTTLEGRSVAETAAALGLEPGMVYVARLRIQKKLKDQIQRLEAESMAASGQR